MIQEKFGPESVVESDHAALQPWIQLQPQHLKAVCFFLRDDERLYFDYLVCLSGIDRGLEANQIGVVYHLMSFPKEQEIVLHCFVPREGEPEINQGYPTLPSLEKVWRSADWHEREAYDLLGIWFEGHPDLRRILLPEDWEGHPLRKDYTTPETYHGIKVDY